MKGKIGIVTMINDFNVGNRLQNYAVQEVYHCIGFKAITLGRYGGSGGFRNSIGLKSYNLIKLASTYFSKRGNSKFYFYRYNKLINFSKAASRKIVTGKLTKKYDYFSSGSDQNWNPKFAFLSPVDLLTFSPKEKNISFSASIGLDSLDGECDREFVKNAFLNFAHISVREQRAKEIIEEMTGRSDVEVFPDPTLLLTKEKWQRIERGGVKSNQKYIFIFFLSDINNDARDKIYFFAHKNGYAVLEWSPVDSRLASKTGPAEWLYIVHHASYVCTDSFHACVFSLIFNVPFTIYRRDFAINMYSRIETLLKTFALDGVEYDGEVKIPSIDFDCINQKLESERNRTINILRKWLN